MVIAAAQDSAGEVAAGPWYDKAQATFTTLIDTTHAISTAFGLINVPMGIWIDEHGRLVRPPEPAWTYTRTTEYGGKPITTDGDAYLHALRDWVARGDRSEYALTDDEFTRRATPRAPIEREADASFKLAVWLHREGHAALARTHFARAQALCPDNWNYHRQEWSFAPSDASERWLRKFLQTDEPYYPKLRLKDRA